MNENKFEENLLLSITKYLIWQNNDSDKEIAQNLSLTSLTINKRIDDWDRIHDTVY